MKCDNCKYCQYDRADNVYLCRFGWEEEDSKGNCGCRYNQKTLDKKYKILLDEDIKAFSEFCRDFCKFMEEKNEIKDD